MLVFITFQTIDFYQQFKFCTLYSVVYPYLGGVNPPNKKAKIIREDFVGFGQEIKAKITTVLVMYTYLHVNSIGFGNGQEHVTSNVGYPIVLGRRGNHMGQVEVDTLDVGVSPHNLRE